MLYSPLDRIRHVFFGVKKSTSISIGDGIEEEEENLVVCYDDQPHDNFEETSILPIHEGDNENDYDNRKPSHHQEEINHSSWYCSKGGHYFLSSYDVTIFTCFCILLYKMPILYYMLFEGYVHRNRLTYWVFSLSIFYYLFLFGLMIIYRNRRHASVLRYYVLFATPVITGVTFIISTLIVLILSCDDWLFVNTTKIAGGKLTVGETMGANWAVHDLPWIEISALHIMGLNWFIRSCLRRTPSLCMIIYTKGKHLSNVIEEQPLFICSSQKTATTTPIKRVPNVDAPNHKGNQETHYRKKQSETRKFWGMSETHNDDTPCDDVQQQQPPLVVMKRRGGYFRFWFYLLWCVVGPIVPVLIYCFFFDPFVQYPTGLGFVLPTIIVGVVALFIGLLQWISVMTSHRDVCE